ncbi:MAG TPA: hypothetical protein VMF59_15255 [Bacteroidota bacterium]|nr:hypothetical protein [Bacteroidota bacterium]
MTPAIGIGFLSLTGILFVAYVLFLVEQHKLQEELARHCKEEEDERGHPKERLYPVIEVWICTQCGFMSTIQSFCIHCSAPRPQETPFVKVGLKEYVEQPGPVFPEGETGDSRIHTLVPRESGRRQAHAH